MEGHACLAGTQNGSAPCHPHQCSNTVLQLHKDGDAWQFEQLTVFSAADGDIIAAQTQKRAVPILEGTCNGYAALHPKLA